MSLTAPSGLFTHALTHSGLCRLLPLLLAVVLAYDSLGETAHGQAPGRGPLPRSAPEAQAVSSDAIRAFVEAADQQVDTMHSFMLVRHGYVIAEAWWKPEAAEKPHVLYSLSKSFTSTAVGLAIAEGKLSLDDKVLGFFPEEAPAEPSKNLASMRVRDLLTMSTGQESEPKFSETEPWVKTFLAHPVPFKPGTHFLYNTPATHICSAIVRKVTGETVLDYLTPRLFQPLGIQAPEWGASPQGNTIGGYGLHLRTEDIATFGQLYLQKGRWHDQQLVPQEWVEQATSRQVSNGSDPERDWDQGYGFQFWRCRHNAYRGDGAKGQFCIVLPEHDAVIAITAQTGDMQQQLNLVWNLLLPALGSAALPADPVAEARLKKTLGNLAVRPAEAGANTATRPVPKLDSRKWQAKHEAMNRQAAQGGIDLVYIGDSIVENYLRQGKDSWDHYYGSRRPLNLGIGGDRTQHVLWRLQNGNIDGLSPRLAIVMIGQNNGGHNSAEEIAAGVTDIVRLLREKLPSTKILLQGIFQRREEPTPEREVLAAANEIIAKLADDKQVFYIDVNRLFVRPDGSIPADLMPDYEHPSPLGHQIWAEAIEPKVAELFGDQPKATLAN